MKRITNFEIGTLTYFLMRAFFVSICFNSIIHIAKQDSYISIILGSIVGIIPLISFYFIFNYEPNLNIFDKNNKLFGVFLGYIINFLLILFTLLLSFLLFLNLITFISSEYLDKTPTIIISISLSLTILHTIIKGFNSILRASSIFFFLSIILFIISISGLLFKINLNNFSPSPVHNYYKASFNFLSLNILPLITLLQIPKNQIINNHKTSKFIAVFYALAIFSMVIMVLSTIGIFGIKLTLLYNYPEFQILKYVYFKGLSSKLNSILFIQNLFDILIFIIFSLFFFLNGLPKQTQKKKNIIVLIVLIIFSLLSEKINQYYFIDKMNINIIPITIFFVISIYLILFIGNLLFQKQEITSNT